jgi:NAD(P)-dependent dehydrogenase (short-subunit alcohol dehydrogenase family)
MKHLNRRSVLAATAGTAALVTTTAFKSPNQPSIPITDLNDISILITGCSSGFGRLMAEYFAREGATVFASMRNLPRSEGAALQTLANQERLKLHVIEIDVTSDQSVEAGVAEAEAINGRPLDVLVNNAGIGYAGPIELQDMLATKLIFETNVFGPHRVSRAILPGMRKVKSGLIVNISSQLGRLISPSTGQYSPTKFALEAMSEAMGYELVPHGIEVAIIEPGGYPTNGWKNRNKLANELKERLNYDERAAYPELVSRMGIEDGSQRRADPMDIPKLVSEIILMPVGSRPLRAEVHPGRKPQTVINRVTSQVQVDWLGESIYGPWIKDVHNV